MPCNIRRQRLGQSIKYHCFFFLKKLVPRVYNTNSYLAPVKGKIAKL